MNLQGWLGNVGAVQLNPDPPNGINGQCVNAASSWSMAQGGPQLFGNGNDDTAWDIWLTFNHPFFQRVTGGFQPGDILFYSPNNPAVGTGYAGHVDIYVGGSQTADADWNGNPKLQLINLNLASKAAGAFRPVSNNHQGGTDMPLTAAQVDFLYRKAVGRPAMPSDISGNVGEDPTILINALMGAKETADYDDALINHAYQGYLRRAPEDSAVANARQEGRLEYFNHVASSTEAAAVTAQWEAGAQVPALTDENGQLSEQVGQLKTQLAQAQTPAPSTPATPAQPTPSPTPDPNTITITKDGLWAKIKSLLGLS